MGTVRVKTNSDGTVDGEYSIDTQRGEHTSPRSYRKDPGSTLLARLRMAWDTQEPFGRRYWLSIVFRFIADTDSESYRKWRGMTEVLTHYRRGNIRDSTSGVKMEAAFEAADKIGGNLETKFRRKVSIVLIRCHWNPFDAKPQR